MTEEEKKQTPLVPEDDYQPDAETSEESEADSHQVDQAEERDQAAEPKQQAESKTSSQSLYEKLTKKNQQYIFQLNNRLKDGGLDEETRDHYLTEMMVNILAEQDAGVTARQLYGTPTEQSDYLLQLKEAEIRQKEAEEPDEVWKTYLDGAFLLLGVYGIVVGLSSVFSNADSQQVGAGLVSLIANFLLGGLVNLIIVRNLPDPETNKGMWRYILSATVAMILWLAVNALINFYVPASINILIPGQYVLLIGLASILIKIWFKRTYNVKDSIF